MKEPAPSHVLGAFCGNIPSDTLALPAGYRTRLDQDLQLSLSDSRSRLLTEEEE